MSQRNEPTDLDPARASLPDDFFVIRALSQGLLIPNPDGGEPQPGAAQSYDVSTDGLTYTFHLRPGATWSNGEPVTAQDFIESYRRLLDPATAAPKANLFFDVVNARLFALGHLRDFSQVGFRATDATTLVVTIGTAIPQFPLYVASGAWIPVNPRVVARHGRNWTRPENFVGNGLYRLAEWRTHERIVLVRSGPAGTGSHPLPDVIQFLHFDNADAEERAYRAGQIDVTMDVPKTKIEGYATERPAEFHRTPLAETRYLAFNTQRPPLNNLQLRRALSLAIDRRKLVERVTRGGQQAADQFLSPALRGNPPVLNHPPREFYPFSPETAKALLGQAGFFDGKKIRRLELSGWSQTPVLEALQEMWRENLGIEVEIVVREAKVHWSALRSGDYDIGFVTSIPDVADGCAALADFNVGSPDNYPRFSDDALNLRLHLARHAPTASGRAGLLRESEDLLAREHAVLPLYYNAKNWLMSPRVHGWREDAVWTRDYRGIWIETK